MKTKQNALKNIVLREKKRIKGITGWSSFLESGTIVNALFSDQKTPGF